MYFFVGKLTQQLKQVVNDAKRKQCQEDVLNGSGHWKNLMWLGYDSHQKKNYTHAVDYLLYALKQRTATAAEEDEGGHAGRAGNALDMG